MWLKALLVIVASYFNCETIATCTDQIASYNDNTTLLSYMSKGSLNEEEDLPRSSIKKLPLFLYQLMIFFDNCYFNWLAT